MTKPAAPMHHLLVKATVTQATDEGLFSAVISTSSVDRDGDIVEPQAVVEALHAWAPNGKNVPLAWDHNYDTDFIIGHIVPLSVQATENGEVVADGWIDQDIPRGKDAWRLVKSGTLGFSYGYIIQDAVPRGEGKGLRILSMDIFEVTATPIPANADTRVISYKNLKELQEATAAIEQEEEARVIPEDVDPPPLPEKEPEPVKAPEPKPIALPTDALRSVASAIEREEEERTLPQVDAHPEILEPQAPPPPPKALPADALRSAATAIEREEQERTLPEVDPPPAPVAEQKPEPPAPPVPPDAGDLAREAAAVEREEQERLLPNVDPPPAPAVVEPPPAPEPPVPPDPDALKHAAAVVEREEAERRIPDVNPPPAPEPKPKPKPAPPPPPPPSVAELRAAATALEREEAERTLPQVDPPPPPKPKSAPKPKQPATLKALRAAADALEREEAERRIPDVNPPPPLPPVVAKPEPAPVPQPLPVLKHAAAAIEREEAERRIPTVNPPPPEPVVVKEPEPDPIPPTPVELKHATTALERAEAERHIPEVIVVQAEPVIERKTGVVDLMAQVREVDPTDDELIAFAQHLMTEVGGKSVEDLEAQVKRLERDEQKHRADATAKAAEVEGVRAQVADAHEALLALEHFEPTEVEGMKTGTLKAVWTTAYINDLPDSAFLYIEEGGTKDATNRTAPRALRHFPYKNADGVLDLPHLRNALARIPTASLPRSAQERLTIRAERILDNAKQADVTPQEKGAHGHGSQAVDPLRKQADDAALEHFSDGLDRQTPPRPVESPKPHPEHDLKELKQRMFEETLTLLSD